MYGRLKIARQLDISVLSFVLPSLLFLLMHGNLKKGDKEHLFVFVPCLMLLVIILKSISTNFVLTASKVLRNYLHEGISEGVSCGFFKGPAFSS